MAKKTEQRILQAALHRFNKQGYLNVILQRIADEANISVGNLAYHYPNKHSLLEVLAAEWESQWQLLLTDLQLTPIFENFNRFLQATYDVQKQYQFIYIDQLGLIRNYPKIKTQLQEYFLRQNTQLEILLELYIARGVLDPKGINIATIAKKIRRIMDNWRRQHLIEDQEDLQLETFQSDIWLEMKYYFTTTGLAEYQELTITNSEKIDTGAGK